METVEIVVEEEIYPQRLLKIKNFPTKIYAIGDTQLLNSTNTIGVVGSRKCTEYGRRVASEFTKKFSEKGICVVSGMAVGIDGIAHNTTIEERGKTIAVLGSGFNYIYPSENEWLFHKILDNGGCVISEYEPETKPDKKYFPTRNRLISGLSDALLVVEAGHRSGSSITAKYAKAQGKKVYAIPQNIYNSSGIGVNRLIQEGAFLVTKPEEILRDIDINDTKLRKSVYKTSSKGGEYILNEKEEKKVNIINEVIPQEYLEICKILSNEPTHINEISKKTKKTIQETNSLLTLMEIEGFISQPQINYFVRQEEMF